MRRCHGRLAAALAAVLALALVADGERRQPLRFAPGGRFKVALFADLHYGENAWTDWGPAQDDRSDCVMAAVLDAEKPDFVVYLGDLVTANNVPIPNATLYWDRALSPARRRRIPWATVFGNHDDMPFEWPAEWFSPDGIPPLHCPPGTTPASSDCSFQGTPRMELMSAEIDRGGGLSRSSLGPDELWPGVSNYVLQVLSRGKEQDPALLMYFLDSGGGSYPEVLSAAQPNDLQKYGPEPVSLPQSAWQHCCVAFPGMILSGNYRIPELIFWHIPSTAYTKVAPKAKSKIRKPCVGSLNMEDVAPQEAEWGMMDALANRPSVKAIFVGHNHGLDWCCPYEKLWLCFARHTGHGGYGSWPRGARIVEIAENPFSVDSWIRMENGTTHSHVVLS